MYQYFDDFGLYDLRFSFVLLILFRFSSLLSIIRDQFYGFENKAEKMAESNSSASSSDDEDDDIPNTSAAAAAAAPEGQSDLPIVGEKRKMSKVEKRKIKFERIREFQRLKKQQKKQAMKEERQRLAVRFESQHLANA
jgi:hypothetical protein